MFSGLKVQGIICRPEYLTPLNPNEKAEGKPINRIWTKAGGNSGDLPHWKKDVTKTWQMRF